MAQMLTGHWFLWCKVIAGKGFRNPLSWVTPLFKNSDKMAQQYIKEHNLMGVSVAMIAVWGKD